MGTMSKYLKNHLNNLKLITSNFYKFKLTDKIWDIIKKMS
jgi:hypothetical protein